MRMALVFLWFLFWPVSELFGRPVEFDDEIERQRVLKLLAVAMWTAAIVVVIVALTE